MSIADATTGHSRSQEKKFTSTLVKAIGIAVLIGAIIMIFFMKNENMDQVTPTTTDTAAPQQHEAPAGAPTVQ